MAVQNTIYLTDGTTRTFPSTKHIATIQHVGVWVKRTSDSVWVVVSTSDYTLVQNAIIFDTAPDSVLYSHVEVRVADNASELTTSPSDITLVAGSIANVDIVATNINSVNTNTTNIGAINTVSGSIGVVTTVATNIANVNSIATTVVPNMAEILLADDNAVIATTQAGIATSAANSATATLNEFKGIFLGTFTAHPLVADVGDMYFNSATNVLYFKGTTTWIPSINPTSSTTTETLIPITTLGQTLSIGYTVGLVEVYLNGIRLTNGDDFVATDGLSISLAIGASYQWDVGDSVLVVSYDVDTRSLYTAPEVDALLTLKANINNPTFTGTVGGVTKAMVGLGNVDNTSDLNKPISTATQTALNNKKDAFDFAVETYTPIGTKVTNLTTLTPSISMVQLIRHNGIYNVAISGTVTIAATAIGAYQGYLSLAGAANFTVVTQAAGVGTAGNTSTINSFKISANTVNDTLQIDGYAGVTTALSYRFTAQYYYV